MSFPYLVKPWQHQLTLIERAARLPAFGLFLEMGCGKTATAINIMRHKYVQHKRVLRTLILCPPIVIENWGREWKMHSKVGDQVLRLTGSGTKRAKLFDAYNTTKSIVVTNYESLLMEDLFQKIFAWSPEAIIFDESHRLKNMAAKRTKRAIQLADGARYKYILTGTPILNSPMDLFPQFRIMDGGATFGKNYFVFRAQYFQDKNAAMPKAKYFPNWQLRPGALEALNAKISPVSMVVKKEECMDLPPLVLKTVAVDLSPTQAKIYNDLKRDFIAYVNGGACVATLAITKALRLQQIVSGFVTLEGVDGEERTNVDIKDNPRATALEEMLAEICSHSKTTVWNTFRQGYATARAICEKLGIAYVEVHGEISAKGKQEAVDRFNTDPNVRVFIGHPASGGIGINLVAASYSIFYSRSFSLADYLQAAARNYRGGSEIHAKVTQIDIVARGTIDELVAQRLSQKLEMSDAVLRDIAQAL